ncbi:hypothetical protein B0J11DRAFT_215099 [Dendryphion nanum]|uniref:Uncharacterized protein n=1 Tax=Dendryphion nanum TaxID=256645 RepID=A0A9P9E8S8_9PLEO|nr:hypothetical protein B0J11DRAFT_215099 [Dendryphion nanum]
MAANDEKPLNLGAAAPVNETINSQQLLRTAPSNVSDMSTKSATVGEKENIDASNPFSAFYRHPNARRSMDDNNQSKTHLDVNIRDLEAGTEPLSAATTQAPKVSVDGRVKECTMWPSRQAMADKKKMYKRGRGCNLFRNLNSKQRLWAKILIALFVVAAAVGLGVGISRAVGGGVWSGQNQSKPIPNN